MFHTDSETSGMQLIPIGNTHNENSNNRFHTYKKYGSIAFLVLCGICGTGLIGAGIYKYLQHKTFSAIGFLISGSASLSIPVAYNTKQFITKLRLFESSGTTSRITAESLLQPKRSNATTISGACRILGIPEDQIEATKLATQYNTIKNGLENRIARFTEKNNNRSSQAKLKPESEPLPIEAIRLMIGDVEQAYLTLKNHLDSHSC